MCHGKGVGAAGREQNVSRGGFLRDRDKPSAKAGRRVSAAVDHLAFRGRNDIA